MRTDTAVEQRLAQTADHHCIGQVSAVIGNKLTITTTGGATPTIPRLATWTPAIGDIVLVAKTPGGWVAVGKIA